MLSYAQYNKLSVNKLVFHGGPICYAQRSVVVIIQTPDKGTKVHSA